MSFWNDLGEPGTKATNIAAIGTMIVIGVVIIGVIIAASSSNMFKTKNKSDNTQAVQKKPEQQKPVDNKDLDMKVVPYATLLSVTNNENGDLSDCEVRINPGNINSGYSYKIDLPGHEEVKIAYPLFTKNAERFNVMKYAVKDVQILNCKGHEMRRGFYSVQ